MNPGMFLTLIRNRGEDMLWLRAEPCVCLDPADPTAGEHRGCSLCEYGYVYEDPVLIRGVVVQQQRDYFHVDLGFLPRGEVILITSANVPIDMWDKVVLTQRAFEKKERVRRGEEGSDPLLSPYSCDVIQVSDDTTVYTADDYEFDADKGVITWKGNRPATDATYIVHYRYHPVYWYTGSVARPARWAPYYGQTMPRMGRLEQRPPVEG